MIIFECRYRCQCQCRFLDVRFNHIYTIFILKMNKLNERNKYDNTQIICTDTMYNYCITYTVKLS